jgi:succinyl-diaminopimelate desuccinylase
MDKTSICLEGIHSWLRERQDEMASLLADLVSIPTENPPGRNYRACVDLLERRLQGLALPCERIATVDSHQESAECLIATYGRGQRVLHFHGHYDVVPAQSPEQFRPTRREHFLHGRGTCDMKGGIVAMLYAIAALKEAGADLNGRIQLTLVPDEETGGERGSAWLTQHGLLGRDGVGMLLPEPTSGVVWNANRGAISLRVKVRGKSAHVGLQHQGQNAFERMHRVVEKLQHLKREVESRETCFNVGSAQRINSILMLGGEVSGGTNFNVVPRECSFTIDRRINPEEDLTAEKAALLRVLEDCRAEGIPVEWQIFQEAPSASCSHDDPLGKSLAHNIRLVNGEAPRFELCPGLLEIRFYIEQGIPAYAYGPGLLSVAHGPNEYVDLERIVDTAAIYALVAADMLVAREAHSVHQEAKANERN